MASSKDSDNPPSPWLDVEWELRELIESERYQRNQDIRLIKQNLESRLTKLEKLIGSNTKPSREHEGQPEDEKANQTTLGCIFGTHYDPRREEEDLLVIQDEDREHDSETIPLRATIWDSAVLVADESQAEGKTLLRYPFILSMILLNVLVQSVFLIGLRTSLTRNPYSEEVRESMRSRRLYENQAWDNVNFATGETKAKTLCNGGVFNSLGEALEDLQVYTSSFTFGFESWEKLRIAGVVHSIPGGYIALVAMLIWILSMTTEIRRAFKVMIAVLSLPRRRTGTVDHVIESCTIVYMRRRNKFFLICVAFVPRIVIDLMLLFAGIRFIAYTPLVGELILNACALEIVKNVDEYVFSAFADKNQEGRITETSVFVKCEKGVVSSIMAIHFNRQIHRFVLLVGVLAALCFGIHAQNQFSNDIQNAEDEVCGHDIGFAWAPHPVSGMPSFTHFGKEHQEKNETVDSISCYYASVTEMLQIRAGFEPTYFPDDAALRALIDGSAPSCSWEAQNTHSTRLSSNVSKMVLCPQAPLTTFTRIQSLSQSEYIEDPGCGDQDVSYVVVRRTCLNESFQASQPMLRFFENRSDCESIADICVCGPNETNPVDGTCHLQSPSIYAESRFGISRGWIVLLRKLCPLTCGVSEKGKPCGKPHPHEGKGQGKGRRLKNRSNGKHM